MNSTGCITLDTLVKINESFPRTTVFKYAAVRHKEYGHLWRIMGEQLSERLGRGDCVWRGVDNLASFYDIEIFAIEQRAPCWLFTNRKLWVLYCDRQVTERVLEYLAQCGNASLKETT